MQQRGVMAPASVKIDGKAEEWGKLEANNTTTELQYTIANDDKKLYLVAQTDVAEVYNRIINGGIKFIIQKNGRKSEEGAVAVKFPYLEKPGMLLFNSGAFRIMVDAGNINVERTNVQNNMSANQADSVMKSHNGKLAAGIKWIYTNGIAGVDTLMPIYNDKGIAAAIAFDGKKVFTFEMAIDLKVLGFTANNPQKFAYRVVVNGTPNKYSPNNLITVTGGASAERSQAVTDQLRNLNETVSAAMVQLYATTDFWGEYTLVK